MENFVDLRIPTRESLLADINHLNGTTLRPSDVIFGIPKPQVGGEENTEVEVTGLPGGLYDGVINFKYNRRDLQELFNIHGPLRVKWPSYPQNRPANTHRLLNLVNRTYGLNLTPNDILFEKIIGEVNEWEIKSAPESIGWMGDIYVIFGDPVVDLKDIWEHTRLTDLKYPAPYDEEKGYLQVLTFNVDATSFYQELEAWALNLPYEVEEIEWEIGTHLLDDNWVSNPLPEKNNIYGATMVYRGPVEGSPYPTGLAGEYTHMAVIQPSELCTNWQGVMLFHYNIVE